MEDEHLKPEEFSLLWNYLNPEKRMKQETTDKLERKSQENEPPFGKQIHWERDCIFRNRGIPRRRSSPLYI